MNARKNFIRNVAKNKKVRVKISSGEVRSIAMHDENVSGKRVPRMQSSRAHRLSRPPCRGATMREYLPASRQ